MKLADEETVQKDQEALYIGNLNTVESNLILPVKGKYGSRIRWESEDERYITRTGKVTRPTCGMGSRTVKLTAFLTCKGAEEKKEFKVTLIENKSEIHILDVYPIHLKGQVNVGCYLPFYVPVRTETGYFMHEAVWKCGMSITSREAGTHKVCFHATGELRILEKARYMAKSLKQCQKTLSEERGYSPGFLSAYSEEQFDLLEKYTPYPQIWAPYYTLHKILAGLLDCEKWAGISEALEIADKIGEWIFQRLNRLNQGQRLKMWSIYIAGEFGGINESCQRMNGKGTERFLL